MAVKPTNVQKITKKYSHYLNFESQTNASLVLGYQY